MIGDFIFWENPILVHEYTPTEPVRTQIFNLGITAPVHDIELGVYGNPVANYTVSGRDVSVYLVPESESYWPAESGQRYMSVLGDTHLGYTLRVPTQQQIEDRIAELQSLADQELTEENENTIYLMNPHTGTVQSESEWRADFESCSPEEWGGEHFEDAELIEVARNIPGSSGYDPSFGEWREINN